MINQFSNQFSRVKIITNVIESLIKVIDEPVQISIEYNYPQGYCVGRLRGKNLRIMVYSDGSFNIERMVDIDEDTKKTKWFI